MQCPYLKVYIECDIDTFGEAPTIITVMLEIQQTCSKSQKVKTKSNLNQTNTGDDFSSQIGDLILQVSH